MKGGSTVTVTDIDEYFPTARELKKRVHEMQTCLMGDAAWDPRRLLALPSRTTSYLLNSLERRGCRGSIFADAICLPFLLYCTDTVYLLRLFAAMRSLATRAPFSKASVREHLGVYAGIAGAIVEAGSLLRSHFPPEQLLPVLGLQGSSFLANRQLVFRGVWMQKGFKVHDLCRCYNFTSWSLWMTGALSVLKVYRRCVPGRCDVPVILITLRREVMHLALPTTALYFAASPDGKPAGKPDCPDAQLPPSNLRPKRSDGGAAQTEKEIVLPPLCRLNPMSLVMLRDLRSSKVAAQLQAEWHLERREMQWLADELDMTYKECVHGKRALRKEDSNSCVCLFVSGVTGSWFDE